MGDRKPRRACWKTEAGLLETRLVTVALHPSGEQGVLSLEQG